MHSSDETGDEPGRVAPTPSSGATPEHEPEPGKHPVPPHAFRERIRRASVAAAQSAAEPLPVPISSLPPEPGVATKSSLPPEHSGVRDRPEDSKSAPTAATAVFVSTNNARRMTPRAWPFAGGTRGDAKRPSSPPGQAEASAERAPAEAKLPPSPGAYSVSPPSALATTTTTTNTTEAASWSPTSTKPQRASLLRTHEAAGDSGRYSVRETSIDYVDAKRAPLPPPPAGAGLHTPTPPSVLAQAGSNGQLITPVVNKAGHGSGAPRDLRDTVREGTRSPGVAASAASAKAAAADRSRVPTADHRLNARGAQAGAHENAGRQPPKNFVAEEDETTSRARRYTPKQRPAQRRGRAYERGSPGARIKEERAELARTLPDIRTTMPGRPGALQSSAPVSPESPTQPKGRPVSRPPSSPNQRAASAPPPLPAAQRDSAAPVHEASIVVDPELLGAPSPLLMDASARSTRPGSRTRAQARAGSAEAVPSADLVDTLPDGISEPSQVRRSAVPLSRYEPLPSDPAAFERLMRDRAATRAQPGARLNWNQQETLLIPRDSLRPTPTGPLANLANLSNRGPVWGVAAAVVVIAVIGTVLLLRSGSAGKGLRVVPLSTTTHALTQAESTVIATEPAGAELLQSGAVLGNTPLEVRRPKSGEITYVVRLQGFEAETVVVSPSSKPTIRVNLHASSH